MWNPTDDDKKGARAVYRETEVCSECVTQCKGVECDRLDYRLVNRQNHDVSGPPCSHCEECEGINTEDDEDDEGDDRPRYCDPEHLCDKAGESLCEACESCESCIATCCWNAFDEYAHYAGAYAVEERPEGYGCAHGHLTDRDVYERRRAYREMIGAGVPLLL